jgi:hypothetical protein
MQCNVQPICLCAYHFCCSCFVSGAAQGAGVQAGIFISMLNFIVTLPCTLQLTTDSDPCPCFVLSFARTPSDVHCALKCFLLAFAFER